MVLFTDCFMVYSVHYVVLAPIRLYFCMYIVIQTVHTAWAYLSMNFQSEHIMSLALRSRKGTLLATQKSQPPLPLPVSLSQARVSVMYHFNPRGVHSP